MYNRYKILTLNILPVILLVSVVVTSFWYVQTDNYSRGAQPARSAPAIVAPSILETPVITQAVIIAANSPYEAVESAGAVVPAQVISRARLEGPDELLRLSDPGIERGEAQVAASEAEEQANRDKVWGEIKEAISGLNELVGAEMFLGVKRKQKAQMEVRLDGDLWSRVRYETRANLKTDISDLWHLYVKQYGLEGSSVVYFMNDREDKVIDIFSKAN